MLLSFHHQTTRVLIVSFSDSVARLFGPSVCLRKLPPNSQPYIFPSDFLPLQPAAAYEPSQGCNGCLHILLSLPPGRFIPHHGNEVCCRDAPRCARAPVQRGLLQPHSDGEVPSHVPFQQRGGMDPDPPRCDSVSLPEGACYTTSHLRLAVGGEAARKLPLRCWRWEK